jgi:hypothetical protein
MPSESFDPSEQSTRSTQPMPSKQSQSTYARLRATHVGLHDEMQDVLRKLQRKGAYYMEYVPKTMGNLVTKSIGKAITKEWGGSRLKVERIPAALRSGVKLIWDDVLGILQNTAFSENSHCLAAIAYAQDFFDVIISAQGRGASSAWGGAQFYHWHVKPNNMYLPDHPCAYVSSGSRFFEDDGFERTSLSVLSTF